MRWSDEAVLERDWEAMEGSKDLSCGCDVVVKESCPLKGFWVQNLRKTIRLSKASISYHSWEGSIIQVVGPQQKLYRMLL